MRRIWSNLHPNMTGSNRESILVPCASWIWPSSRQQQGREECMAQNEEDLRVRQIVRQLARQWMVLMVFEGQADCERGGGSKRLKQVHINGFGPYNSSQRLWDGVQGVPKVLGRGEGAWVFSGITYQKGSPARKSAAVWICALTVRLAAELIRHHLQRLISSPVFRHLPVSNPLPGSTLTYISIRRQGKHYSLGLNEFSFLYCGPLPQENSGEIHAQVVSNVTTTIGGKFKLAYTYIHWQ
ncbi:hypothetical protein B0H17DRAFT_1132616 [Mycena rosella]|uniref:Uncharacterized protein n=1 Tax=Mycena rosella TaxID=1033263 RepID=A0AAD7DK58_MYCRO|nr:hypothetical protein B0H17DRAFT_1132616 [Mycena rosella]